MIKLSPQLDFKEGSLESIGSMNVNGHEFALRDEVSKWTTGFSKKSAHAKGLFIGLSMARLDHDTSFRFHETQINRTKRSGKEYAEESDYDEAILKATPKRQFRMNN